MQRVGVANDMPGRCRSGGKGWTSSALLWAFTLLLVILYIVSTIVLYKNTSQLYLPSSYREIPTLSLDSNLNTLQ
eukprot:5353753-Ditylum_brightwellii.AAC.1